MLFIKKKMLLEILEVQKILLDKIEKLEEELVINKNVVRELQSDNSKNQKNILNEFGVLRIEVKNVLDDTVKNNTKFVNILNEILLKDLLNEYGENLKSLLQDDNIK